MEYRKDWIERWAMYSPIKTAVSDADSEVSYTYAQLNNLSNYLSLKFQEKGLIAGDRVVVVSEFRPELVVLLGVGMKLGIVIVPLNYRLSTREVTYLIGNCEPKLMLVEEKFSHLIEKGVFQQEVMGLQELVKELNSVVEQHDFQSVNLPQSHPLFIMYTSGTTGVPKGAIYTHEMAFWNAVNTQSRLEITSKDHTLICMPPFHTGGWNVLLLPFLFQGASFTLLKKFDATNVLDLLEKEEITVFMGVPTMLKMMHETDRFDSVGLTALRYLIVGGEAMPLYLIEKWEEKGVPIRQGYGLTEVGPNVTSLHQDDAIRKIGSIGKPNFYIDAILLNDQGKEVKPYEPGELCLKGPTVTPGYWKNPEASKDAFHEEWFKTGDIMIKDSEGYLFVIDRIKNMFISGGENVYPAEVEKFLLSHNMIDEVVVIGIPDDRWGEVGKAFIKSKDPSLDTETLKEFCKGNLAKFKIPKYIEFVSEIPKTDSGKVDRKRLKQLV